MCTQDHAFAETFARRKYDGNILSEITKADIVRPVLWFCHVACQTWMERWARVDWVLDTCVGDDMLSLHGAPKNLYVQDEDFPDVSAFHRRALFHKIKASRQAPERRQLKTVDLNGYTAVKVRKDKAAVIMGKNNDIKLWRSPYILNIHDV